MPSPDSTCELMTSTQHENAVKVDAETWIFQGARISHLGLICAADPYTAARRGGQHPGVHAAGEGDASVAAERMGREKEPQREDENEMSLRTTP